MKKHFFLGSGDYAQEILKWSKFYKKINFAGFVDEKSNLKNKITLNYEKFSNKKEITNYTIVIGNPLKREMIAKQINNKLLTNSSIIFDSCQISHGVKIGKGCIIMNNVTIANDVKIGANCHIHGNAIIGHNTIIGNNVNIGANVFIAGFSKIKKCTIINANSVIVRNINIGEYSIVGSGSVVINDVKKKTSVFGSPAKKIFGKS